MTQDASVRAFLLTNISLPTSSNPYVHFRIPISILEEALPEIGGFPYKPEEREWLGNTLLIQGSLSRSVFLCYHARQFENQIVNHLGPL
jgi:hypothetical protein